MASLCSAGLSAARYLGQVQGYNAEQIGNVLAWTGLPQLLLIPLVPKLMQRFDIRYIATVGLLLFAASSFLNITMSLDYSGDQFFIPNVVRAVGRPSPSRRCLPSASAASRRRMRLPPPASPT